MSAERTKTPADGHEKWREKVLDYVAAGDRGEEPHYVGRKDVFEKVDLMVLGATRGQTDSRTIVVTGAPGAGKTAFMRELAKRRNGPNCPGAAVWLRPGGMNAVRLFRELSDVLSVPVEKRTDYYRTFEVGGDAKVLAGKYARARVDTEPGDIERAKESDEVPWALIAERFGEHLNADNPLILLCDEAQNMKPGDALSTFADSLHAGKSGPTGMPLVPVFPGLSDTGDKINKCGITRPTDENDITLGGLSDAEAGEYVLKTLEHLEAEATSGERAKWMRWFVDNCDGWPQHLRTAMTAVAKAMRKADTSRLQELDIAQIALDASAARNRYYGKRVEATEFESHKAAFGQLVKAAGRTQGGGLHISALEDVAIDYAREYAERTGESLAGPTKLVAAAVHAGILQRTRAGGYYACPIPSMHDYLVTGKEHEVPRPPLSDRGLGR